MRLTNRLKKVASVALGRGGRDGKALQVGALPYRRRTDGSIEVLLVTTRGTGQWMVPKGWPMSGKTLPESAAQEAWEEAGVRGATAKRELGRFRHEKTDIIAGLVPCIVAVFPLAVEEEATSWPERRERTRTWFGLDEAIASVQSRALAGILAAAKTL
jgi:8-oxo-dGTP pyrophosphatase MutT (NUDIX family)